MNWKTVISAAAVGMAVAMKTDYNAFAAWKANHPKDDVKFEWQTAVWRWFMGAFIGALLGFTGDQVPQVRAFLTAA